MSLFRDSMNLIKMEGGGFSRPNADNELPIDIQYQKLSAWLVIPAFPCSIDFTCCIVVRWTASFLPITCMLHVACLHLLTLCGP